MEKNEIVDILLDMDLEDYENLQIEFKKKIQDNLDLLIKEYKDIFNKFIKERTLYFQVRNEFLKILDKCDYYKKSINSRQVYNETHRYNTRSKEKNLKPKKEPLDEKYKKIQNKYIIQLSKFNKTEKQYLTTIEKLKQSQLNTKKSYTTFYKKLHGSNADIKHVEIELKNYTIK